MLVTDKRPWTPCVIGKSACLAAIIISCVSLPYDQVRPYIEINIILYIINIQCIGYA